MILFVILLLFSYFPCPYQDPLLLVVPHLLFALVGLRSKMFSLSDLLLAQSQDLHESHPAATPSLPQEVSWLLAGLDQTTNLLLQENGLSLIDDKFFSFVTNSIRHE
eukprot:GCRY01005827.1.p2 GENE.GCRY01005827.1~~GCRY01005827.1.p2  ORF type:complete len:107 (-),score=29.50 GCRY01005827.1:85-405(-)